MLNLTSFQFINRSLLIFCLFVFGCTPSPTNERKVDNDNVTQPTQKPDASQQGNKKKKETVWQGPLKDYFEKHIAKPHAFPIQRSAHPKKEKFPNWWKKPKPLTQEEIEFLRYFSRITWQLPKDQQPQIWTTGDGGFTNPIRFSGAFTGYAATAMAMRTPAYIELTTKIIESTIDHLLNRKAWKYIVAFGKSRDPAAKHNIMLTGHLLQLMAFYEAMTGGDRYQKEGFVFEWSPTQRFQYNVKSLINVTVKQMRESPYGAVHCEPNLIFFACNDHPHIALKLFEELGMGDWSLERARFENWSLDSFYDNLGGGAFKVAFDAKRKVFTPTGFPGGDSWDLVGYKPWATDPEVPDRIWRITRKYIRWDELEGRTRPHEKKTPGPADFVTIIYNELAKTMPAGPATTGLYTAALSCNDPATAARLKEIIKRKYLVKKDGEAYLDIDPKYKIGTTATMAMGVAMENGSNLRDLIHSPLPRAYFTGPLIEEVRPPKTAVYQAYREGKDLIVELDDKGPLEIQLKNVPSIKKIEGLPKGTWHYKDNNLHVDGTGRRHFRIVAG